MLPDETGIVSGTYRPAGYGSLENAATGDCPELHRQPSLTHGTATLDSVFGGLFIGGTWNLIVRDDFTADTGSLGCWSIQGTAAVIVKPDDFDGNFRSDILWQRSDGTPAMWQISGDHVVSVGAAGSFNPGPTWHVKDDGDFNGDARSDILWQNDDGTPAIWLMNGLDALSIGAAGPFNPGPSWQIKATGDFNFDTKADILWQSDDGTPAIWLMDGFNALFTGAVGPFNPGPSWQIKATGDFNGDGRSDILWQNDDGTPAIWLMNGMNFIAAPRSASIRGRAGRSRAPATSTATAGPTSCGRAPTARPRSG